MCYFVIETSIALLLEQIVPSRRWKLLGSDLRMELRSMLQRVLLSSLCQVCQYCAFGDTCRARWHSCALSHWWTMNRSRFIIPTPTTPSMDFEIDFPVKVGRGWSYSITFHIHNRHKTKNPQLLLRINFTTEWF